MINANYKTIDHQVHALLHVLPLPTFSYDLFLPDTASSTKMSGAMIIMQVCVTELLF